jgi:hypothetical protein
LANQRNLVADLASGDQGGLLFSVRLDDPH